VILDIRAPGWCDDRGCTAEQTGKYPVTATGVGVRYPGRALLTVVPDAAVDLELRPATARMVAGAEQPYRVFARDRFGNRVGEVTERAVLSITEPGRCDGATCTATVPRGYRVTATVERGDAPALVGRAPISGR
jgi:hypothetical protein